MKRSEILKRARNGEPPCDPNWLPDEALLVIATALGIEVEPDEEPLPERLSLIRQPALDKGCHEGYFIGDAEREDFPTGVLAAVVLNGGRPSVPFSRALLDALISAYNERPKWRTGVPEESGAYIVAGPIAVEAVEYDAEDRRWSYLNTPTSNRGNAGWAHGCPWMPLPAVPK
jgi:hypothetical protein